MAQDDTKGRVFNSFEDAYAPAIPSRNWEAVPPPEKTEEQENQVNVKDLPRYEFLDDNAKKALSDWQQRFQQLLELLFSPIGFELHRRDPEGNRKKITEIVEGSLPSNIKGDTRKTLVATLTEDITRDLDEMANSDYESVMRRTGLDDKLVQRKMTEEQRRQYRKVRDELIKEAERGEFADFLKETKRYHDRPMAPDLQAAIFNPGISNRDPAALTNLVTLLERDRTVTPEQHPDYARFQQWMRSKLAEKLQVDQTKKGHALELLGESDSSLSEKRYEAERTEREDARRLVHVREDGAWVAGYIMGETFAESARRGDDKFRAKHHIRSDDIAYRDGGRLYREDAGLTAARTNLQEENNAPPEFLLPAQGSWMPSLEYDLQSDKAADDLAKAEGRLTNNGRRAMRDLIDQVSQELYNTKEFRALSGDRAVEELRRVVLVRAREQTKLIREGKLKEDVPHGVMAYTERELTDAERLLNDASPELAKKHAAIVPVLKDHDDTMRVTAKSAANQSNQIQPTDPNAPEGHGIPFGVGRGPGYLTF